MALSRLEFWEWLKAGAERELQAAVATLSEPEVDVRRFYIHASTAAELTFSAVLAETNPLLLMAQNSKPAGLWAAATWQGPWAELGAHVKTVPMIEMPGRLKARVPELTLLTDQILQVAQYRNAVLHLGDCPSGRIHDDIAVVLRSVRACYDSCGWDFPGALGPHSATAMSLLDEAADRVRTLVEGRIATLRSSLQERLGEHPDVLTLAVELHRGDWAQQPEYDEVYCPVCDAPAIVDGWIELDPEVEFDQHDEPYIAGYDGQMNLESFLCRVCGLKLSGTELSAAELPRSVHLELDWEQAQEILQEEVRSLHPEWFGRE